MYVVDWFYKPKLDRAFLCQFLTQENMGRVCVPISISNAIKYFDRTYHHIEKIDDIIETCQVDKTGGGTNVVNLERAFNKYFRIEARRAGIKYLDSQLSRYHPCAITYVTRIEEADNPNDNVYIMHMSLVIEKKNNFYLTLNYWKGGFNRHEWVYKTEMEEQLLKAFPNGYIPNIFSISGLKDA